MDTNLNWKMEEEIVAQNEKAGKEKEVRRQMV